MVKMAATIQEFDAATAGLVIIDFTATWCPPCKAIGPVFEAIAGEQAEGGKLAFIKVDVDENEEASQKAGISCMPTFQVWKDGAKVDEFSGADEAKLRELVKKYA
jgi:thioredoxin